MGTKQMMIIKVLLCAGLVTAFSPFTTLAEDVDVYRAFIKNNAMLVVDTSGSMSWPTYDETVDYAGFMRWMIDQGLATDEDECRNGSTWWDADGSGDDYDKLDPDQIYLVSTYIPYDEITYTDSQGNTQTISTIDDVMWNTTSDGYENNSSGNLREELIKLSIIPVKSSGNVNWMVTDSNTIEQDTNGHVVFPSGATVDIDGTSVTIPASLQGGVTLPNYRDVLVTNTITDPNTNEVVDIGFIGALKATGFYFSGVFEKSGTGLEFTGVRADAESGPRVYLFATGRWLNMLKLVEDFRSTSCSSSYTYSHQRYKAWMTTCYKENVTEPPWTTGSITIISHSTEYSCDNDTTYCSTNYDYPDTPTGDDDRGNINPPGTNIQQIQVKFDYIDTDGCNSGTSNDYVDIQDLIGNSLLAIKGQQIGPGTAGSGAAVSYDGGATWTSTSPLDSSGYTASIAAGAVKIVWHNGSGSGCSGYDRGFKITGYRYSDQAPGDPGDFSCCNGADGYGIKIKSRMDVAKNAMKRVVDETRDSIAWGLTRFSGSGTSVVKSLGSTADEVITAIDGLSAGGGTPLGYALQVAYNDNKTSYLDGATGTAECSYNYLVAMTDGFPTGDSSWSVINDSTASSYTNPTFGVCSGGYGACSNYGDADDWPDDTYDGNQSDDVAHWLYTKATHKHTVHSIGFGLNNPMLGDMADSSNGIYITAYSEQQLVNAFYSLGLSMSSAVAFTAPVVSVDQANRTQSGDSLYMAFFRPEEDEWWRGNLKKYGLSFMTRSDCNRSTDEWVVVDKNDNPAGECDGSFDSGSVSYWSTVPDGGDVSAGGAGDLLKAAIDAVNLSSGPHYDFRNIYTCIDPSTSTALVRFYRDGDSGVTDTITAADLGVGSNTERDRIINYVYGYTYAAYDSDGSDATYTEGTDGAPLAKREWILGDMIHSEPTVIDYFDENYVLKHRLIAIGANDGLLHVFVDDFDDSTTADTTIGGVDYGGGGEIWAFVPGDLLDELQDFSDQTVHRYFVDGFCAVNRLQTFVDADSDGSRGAGEYFDKTLVFGERRGGRSYWALNVSDPNPSNWTVLWQIQGGVGGDYDELGYSWSKPTFATIKTGASTTQDVVIFAGGYDTQEDSFPEPWDDVDGDGVFDTGETITTDVVDVGTHNKYNPGANNYGRGIFVADLDTGNLRFKITYGAADSLTGTSQTENNMIYCFPADPTVIGLPGYSLLVYNTDVYGTVWKLTYVYGRSEPWQVIPIFSANPGSNQANAVEGISVAASLDSSDYGRKVFYSPDVSYYGNAWTDYPTLYFGTGDRAHPRYISSYENRFYAFSDTSVHADETDLLNLTCDEMDTNADTDLDGDVDATDETTRQNLYDILYGSTNYPAGTSGYCRGWYKVLGDQGDCTQDDTDHSSEMVLSRPVLFYQNVYFTTYQPVFGDPCNPAGNARVYAIDYSFGTASLDLNRNNTVTVDGNDTEMLQDTYYVIENSSIPSSIRIITRQGEAAALVSAGGSVVGAGETEGTSETDGHSSKIPGPPGGAQQIIWETY